MKKNKNKRKSISAYVRTETPRRCWEIVREVYRELISDDTLDFDLGLFGMNCDELINQSNFSKNVRNDGLISKSQLPKYFFNNDLIIAFSATNYNLILWDCVSIGTPVIDLDIGPLKHLNHPLILKTSPYPDDIIKNIKKAININYEKPKIPFLNSLLWDSRFSDLWEKLKLNSSKNQIEILVTVYGEKIRDFIPGDCDEWIYDFLNCFNPSNKDVKQLSKLILHFRGKGHFNSKEIYSNIENFSDLYVLYSKYFSPLFFKENLKFITIYLEFKNKLNLLNEIELFILYVQVF